MKNEKEEIVEETKENREGYSIGNLIPTPYWDFSIPKIDISGAVKALTQYSNIVGSCVFGMTDRWSKISDSIVRIVTGYTESLNKIGSIASNIISLTLFEIWNNHFHSFNRKRTNLIKVHCFDCFFLFI